MTLTLFGASGAIGKLLLERALAEGHDIRAVVRNPSALTPTPRLAVVRAAPADDAATAEAIRGADAVLSALGTSTKTDAAAVTAFVERIAAAMDRERVSRFVAISGAGVLADGDNRTVAGRVMKLGARLFYADMVAQKQDEYRVIAKSGTDWTLVRPTALTDGPPRGKWRTSFFSPPGPRISRADIATFMLSAVSDSAWSRKAPFVTW